MSDPLHLAERLRWNAENSHTASRLNMAMDQQTAAEEIERLNEALRGISARARGDDFHMARDIMSMCALALDDG